MKRGVMYISLIDFPLSRIVYKPVTSRAGAKWFLNFSEAAVEVIIMKLVVETA